MRKSLVAESRLSSLITLSAIVQRVGASAYVLHHQERKKRGASRATDQAVHRLTDDVPEGLRRHIAMYRTPQKMVEVEGIEPSFLDQSP